MKVGIIGVGIQGFKYLEMLIDNMPEYKVVAITRINDERKAKLKGKIENIKIYQSDEEMFKAIDNKEISLDAVIITTPHLRHEYDASEAFKRGLMVLCDKPAGAYLSQGERMLEESHGLRYGFIFHQRAYPIYKRLYDLVHSGKYGSIKRYLYVVTDWYRINEYYVKEAWRGKYKTDGGGVFMNQCPHSLDIMQHIVGMPESVYADLKFGKYHPIEVEDEGTIILRHKGYSGVFVTSTGETPGVNRFEISTDKALITCYKDRIVIKENEYMEDYYRNQNLEDFKNPEAKVTEEIIETNNQEAYIEIFKNFYNKVENLYVDGKEALNSLILSNAIYLSAFKNNEVKIPSSFDSFNKEFEEEMKKRIK